MSTTKLTVPLRDGSHEIELVYVAEYSPKALTRSSTPLSYLHRVRMLGNKYDDAVVAEKLYTQALPAAAATLAEQLAGGHFDAIIKPPSKRIDADPYIAAVQVRHADIGDWTSCFARVKEVAAGKSGRVRPLYEALTFEPPLGVTTARRILMVDDSFATGKTAAAILQHILDTGSDPKLEFVVGCALRVRNDQATPTTWE